MALAFSKHGMFSLAKTSLLFLVLGPPIGFFTLVLVKDISYAIKQGALMPPAATLVAIGQMFAGLFALVLVSYVAAGLSALLTGIAAWLVRAQLRTAPGSLFCAFIGALLSVLLLPSAWQPLWRTLRVAALPGAVAGGVCGLIYFHHLTIRSTGRHPATRAGAG